MEEYVFVAIEMLRMGLINGNDMTNIPGGAEQGSGRCHLGCAGYGSLLTESGEEQVKTMTNLVSRAACFGRLKHKSVGYSGPLDRQLLSYSFMISAVRSSLRDLVETILVSMFLSHDAEREREEYFELAAGFVN